MKELIAWVEEEISHCRRMLENSGADKNDVVYWAGRLAGIEFLRDETYGRDYE